MKGGRKTGIEGVPEGWKIVRLGDAVEINGASRDPTRENPDEKIFYIDIESVEGGTGIIKIAREILGKEAPSRARRIIRQNDVIMSTVRPYLKAFALVPREYNNQICSTGFAVLSCKNEISPRYLLYTLFSKEVIEQCNKMMMGGQYPALNQSQVAKIEIPLPSLPEQRRIAEVLGTVDSAIQKVGVAIESTERLKKGLMQRLLTRGIGHERFKESELGRVPEEWEVVKLGDISRIKYGLGQPPQTKNDGVPMIRATNINSGKIFEKDVLKIDITKIPTTREVFLKEGDIIVVRSGAYTGDVGLVTKKWQGSVAGYDLIVSSNRDKVEPRFLSSYLLSPQIQKICFMGLKTRSAQSHLNSNQLENISVALPPLPEQRRIAEILGAADRKLELERRRKEKLERVKKGLMNELLTGRKRVKVENDGNIY